MSNLNESNFFDNVGGGSGAPSAKLKELNDKISGEIVDQFMMEATDAATKEPKRDKKTGEIIEQLVVILQTDLRNWQGVARVPLKDKDDRSSGPKDPSEDDGRRAVYVEPWTNLHAAVGKAVKEANDGKAGPLENGGMLAVQVVELRDTGKLNPLKVHQVWYRAPVASGGDFFGDGKTQGGPGDASQQAPAPQQQAAPVQDPFAGQAQAAPQQAAPQQAAPQQAAPQQAAPATQDPWGAPAPTGAAPF